MSGSLGSREINMLRPTRKSCHPELSWSVVGATRNTSTRYNGMVCTTLAYRYMSLARKNGPRPLS